MKKRTREQEADGSNGRETQSTVCGVSILCVHFSRFSFPWKWVFKGKKRNRNRKRKKQESRVQNRWAEEWVKRQDSGKTTRDSSSPTLEPSIYFILSFWSISCWLWRTFSFFSFAFKQRAAKVIKYLTSTFFFPYSFFLLLESLGWLLDSAKSVREENEIPQLSNRENGRWYSQFNKFRSSFSICAQWPVRGKRVH